MGSLDGLAAPPEWEGYLRIQHYHLGGNGRIKLNLNYQESQKLTNTCNVFAVIEGCKEPDRYVLLGNHGDAWTFGAVDPNSGTAALLEIARRFSKLIKHGWQPRRTMILCSWDGEEYGMIARRFSKLIKHGWQPRRTMILCSWDGEEYGMIGSTEWVEQYIDVLSAKAVAYLHVDCAIAGSGFYAAATPQLDVLLQEVTRLVPDPDIHKESVYETWMAASMDLPFVLFGGDKVGEAIGRTRKEAQLKAADSSLRFSATPRWNARDPRFLAGLGRPVVDEDMLPVANASGRTKHMEVWSSPDEDTAQNPVIALKDYCTMEGKNVAFKSVPSGSEQGYVCQVEVAGRMMGKGIGQSWEEAKQRAADEALRSLKITSQIRGPPKRMDPPRSPPHIHQTRG